MERPVHLAKIDCDTNMPLCQRFAIKGYPTIYWFSGNDHEDYKGGRDTDSIVNWLKSKVGLGPKLAVPESNVVTLTDANFDSEINAYKFMAVEFYTPWCGHCKQLQPEWEAAAITLANSDVKLGKVDCDENPNLCSKRFDVKSYPTIYFHEGGYH
jgi:protein disulfide-isomerase A6